MTDHHSEEHQGDDPGQANEPPSDRPDENTAPPSNPEPDPERVEQESEDQERTIPS